MITATTWRELALALPESEEKSHFDQPDFRVHNKIFAGLSVDGQRGVLKLSPDAQAMVLDAAPDVFSAAAGAWGRSGWTHVELARASAAALRPLLREAWQLVAPKRLAAAHGAPARSAQREPKERARVARKAKPKARPARSDSPPKARASGKAKRR